MAENKAEDWHVDDMFPLGMWQQELTKIPVPNRDLCIVLYNEDEIRMGWYYADLAIVRNQSNPEIWIGKERGIWVNPFKVRVSKNSKYIFCCAEAYNAKINKEYSFAYPFFIIDIDDELACVVHHKNAIHYKITEEVEGIFTLRLDPPDANGRFPNRDGEQITIRDLDWEPLQTMRYHYEKYAQSGQVEPYKETLGTWAFDKFWGGLAKIALLNTKWRFENQFYGKYIYDHVANAVLNIQAFVINRRNRD